MRDTTTREERRINKWVRHILGSGTKLIWTIEMINRDTRFKISSCCFQDWLQVVFVRKTFCRDASNCIWLTYYTVHFWGNFEFVNSLSKILKLKEDIKSKMTLINQFRNTSHDYSQSPRLTQKLAIVYQNSNLMAVIISACRCRATN